MTQQDGGERGPLGLGGTPVERDARAVIDEALDLARVDAAAWRHLRTRLVAWVREDETLRRELAGELAALGRGRRGGAKRPDYVNGMLVGLVKVWTRPGPNRLTVEKALLQAASMFPEDYPADLQALKNLYYNKLLKDPEARRIGGLK